MERVPSKTLYHWCNVAITRVVVKDISSGSSLDRFNFVYVLLPEWIPYTGRVFETLWLQPPSTRRKRPRVELAFLQMVLTCSFQLELLDIVTPRYFVELTLDIGSHLKCIETGLETFYMLLLKDNIF